MSRIAYGAVEREIIMREIKFRAWDKHTNVMSQWDEIGIGDQLWGQAHMVAELFSCLQKQRILMQFTGLLDKNGVEIYEGDLMKIPKGVAVMKVVWGNSRWEFVNSPDDYPGESFSGFADEYEIIGNIYENGGLLK